MSLIIMFFFDIMIQDMMTLRKQYEYNWIGKHKHIQAKSFLCS